MGFASENLTRSLGNIMSQFVEYDASGHRNFMNNYMRIVVRLDIREPFMHEKKIRKRGSSIANQAVIGCWIFLRDKRCRSDLKKLGRRFANKTEDRRCSGVGIADLKLSIMRALISRRVKARKLQVVGSGLGGFVVGQESSTVSGNKDGLWLVNKCADVGLKETVNQMGGQGDSSLLSSVLPLTLYHDQYPMELYDHCFTVDRVRSSGGLAVFWNSVDNVSVSRFSSNHIDLVIETPALVG
ncbi:hypothetical protein Golob_007728 [Gossypium lobatum]|uniref:Uncharacterized protein n=1 Tax=Gossypium lobatum TaxID=34289 RepID=A0A7J8MDJ2_9ROSI|nr:hypothetical protein [Gossypium lobatum]